MTALVTRNSSSRLFLLPSALPSWKTKQNKPQTNQQTNKTNCSCQNLLSANPLCMFHSSWGTWPCCSGHAFYIEYTLLGFLALRASFWSPVSILHVFLPSRVDPLSLLCSMSVCLLVQDLLRMSSSMVSELNVCQKDTSKCMQTIWK